MDKEEIESLRQFLQENQEMFDRRDHFLKEIEETLDITCQENGSVLVNIKDM